MIPFIIRPPSSISCTDPLSSRYHPNAVHNTKKAVNYGNKGRSAVSNAKKIKILIAALTALIVVGLALGLGLGLGLKKHGGGDHGNDNDG